jgi:hypothetical protein
VEERVLPGSIVTTHKGLEPPTKREGFDKIYVARIDGTGGFLVEEALVPFAALRGESVTNGEQNER